MATKSAMRRFCSTVARKTPLPVFTSPVCMEHMIPDHPECPERLSVIIKEIKKTLDDGSMRIVESREECSLDALRLVHSDTHVRHLESADKMARMNGGLVHLDGDTAMNGRSLSAARCAAQCAMNAVDSVMDPSTHPRALVAVRPPGHHAGIEQAMGFCLVNHACLASKYALNHYSDRIRKVMIVDWDVHHGNGTQDVVLNGDDHSSLMLISMHQHPCYPGTGTPLSIDEGNLRNRMVMNVPLHPDSDGSAMREAWEQPALKERVCEFQPDLIVVSAGFDAHIDDPLASLRWTDLDYTWLTESVVSMAQEWSDGRVVSILEGGYNTLTLGHTVTQHVSALR